jgi:hypothetical protein
MKKFIIRLVAFSLLLPVALILLAFLTTWIVENRNFKIYQTDSNTLIMGKNKHYGILFSGASHARNLSRHQNHLRLEKILNKSISNIAQGAATCGINEQFFYFKYFYQEGNSVDDLVYLLSPPLLYSEELPVASNTFNEEIFSLRFLKSYLKFDSENKRQRIFEYIRSKFKKNWIFLKPKLDEANTNILEKVDTAAVRQTVETFYRDNTSVERFNKSCKTVEEEVVFAREHNASVTFIIPPAVFGTWPGHKETIDFAKRMGEKYGTRYFDYSESIRDPKLYYDHHHLNTAGVVLFAEKYLKPIL